MCCSRGGSEQIQALETVRLDAADGTLGDGYAEVKMRRMATELIDDSITDLWDSPHLVYAEYERQYAEFRGEAVQEGKAHKGRGGPIMLTLLLWDAGVLLATSALCYAVIVKNGLTSADWLTWYALEYLTIILSIASFPYVFFMVLPKEALTGAHRTGYDVRGWLCRKLSMPEIREARAHYNSKNEEGGVGAAVYAMTGALSAGQKTVFSLFSGGEGGEKRREKVQQVKRQAPKAALV